MNKDPNSPTAVGREGEERVSRKLASLGIKNRRMGHRSPFDIELENGIRIDVKTATKTNKLTVKGWEYEFYRFRIRKSQKQDFTDFFVLVVKSEFYVIPYEAAPNDALFLCTYGYKVSKWDKYLNAFDLLW